jgi:hypothetical protein
VLLLAVAAAASACQHVQPWERNLLARPDMAWESDELAAAQQSHTYFSKEAAMPGGGAGGGGCGCN